MYNKKWSQEDNCILRDFYFVMSVKDLGKKLHRTKWAIYTQAKKLGLKINKYEKHKINELFFDTWSHNMAYVLGLLFTDGNMDKNKYAFNITLTNNDAYILEKILKIMQSDYPIYLNKCNNSSRLIVGRVNMCKSLLKLGLVPKKTFIIKCPNVPKKYYSSFLLGVIDGDGSVSKKGEITIWSASKDFINGLSDMLLCLNINHIKRCRPKNKNIEYRIGIYRKFEVQKIANLMYGHTDVYMIRKFQRLKRFMNIGE